MKSMDTQSPEEIIDELNEENRTLRSDLHALEVKLEEESDSLSEIKDALKDRDRTIEKLEKQISALKDDVDDAKDMAHESEQSQIDTLNKLGRISDAFLDVIQDRFGRAVLGGIKSDIKIKHGIDIDGLSK